MNFDKIREICEERKITIPGLAAEIGISEPGLYQVFRNKSIKVDVLEKISKALAVPIWIFFDLDPETKLKEEIAALRKNNAELMEKIEGQKNTIAYFDNKVINLEHTLELQNNIIHKQGEINEAKERLVEEKERSIKNYEEMMTIFKNMPLPKGVKKLKPKE